MCSQVPNNARARTRARALSIPETCESVTVEAGGLDEDEEEWEEEVTSSSESAKISKVSALVFLPYNIHYKEDF